MIIYVNNMYIYTHTHIDMHIYIVNMGVMQVMCIRDMYISHNIYVNNMHTQTHTHAHICMYIDMHLYIVNTATSTTSDIISNSSPISNTRTPWSTLELRRESQALSRMATRLGCQPSRPSPSVWLTLTTGQMALSHNPAYKSDIKS
jgi:hypothetical protein